MLISKGTSVGAGTVITNSVIGRNCVIGKKKVVSCGLHKNGLKILFCNGKDLMFKEETYNKSENLSFPLYGFLISLDTDI